MLQFMRKYTKGWVGFFVLALVGLPFMFFGVNEYFSAKIANYVAKVGDVEISEQEYRNQFEKYRAQIRSQFGDNYNPAQFEDATFKRNFVDQLIDKELLRQNADKVGLQVTDARIREEIDKIDAFKIDGKFDSKTYIALLKQQGMSPTVFEQEIRRDLTERLLPTHFAKTGIVNDTMIDAQLRLRDQKRDFRFISLPATPAAAAALPADKEVKAYYDSHQDEYKTQEMLSVDYIEIDSTTIPDPMQPDDSVLLSNYESNKARFGTLEARNCAHILVKPTSGDAAAQKIALEKAQELAKKARAGEDFFELAKANTEDPGSKESGGDLGWVEAGITRAAFDKKLFAMKSGEISDPVLTEDGFHVIQLREIRPANLRTFEEVKAELLSEFNEKEKARIFNERSSAMVDATLKNPVSISEAATVAGLTVQRSQMFTRAGGGGIAMNQDVVQAAFSDSVLIGKNNSDPLTIGENKIIVLRLAEHKPSEVQKFDLVKPAVIARLQSQAAEETTRKNAEELLRKAQSGTALASLVPNAILVDAMDTARTGGSQDPAIVREVFKLARPAQGKTTKGQVKLPQGGFAIVELLSVKDGDPKSVAQVERDSMRKQLEQQIGMEESQAFIDALREKTGVLVVEEKL